MPWAAIGLKTISMLEVVLGFAGHSNGEHKPSTGGTDPMSHAEISSGISLRALKGSEMQR